MAVASLPANTLAEAVEFINKNDVDHVWVYKKSVFLGSFLPKVFGLEIDLITFTNQIWFFPNGLNSTNKRILKKIKKV